MVHSVLKEREAERQEKLKKLKELGFQVTKEGVIAYKTFGGEHLPPDHWRIRKGSTIESEVNHDQSEACGFGINVALLEWVEEMYGSCEDEWDDDKEVYTYQYSNIWKVLIKHEWLDGVCIPNSTYDLGKIRTERALLLDYLKGDNPIRKKIRKSLGIAEFSS